jgi:hypothetical protein
MTEILELFDILKHGIERSKMETSEGQTVGSQGDTSPP